MRIVYEAPLFRGVGGGPRHFEGVARGLRKLGHAPVLVLPRSTSVELTGFVRRSLPAPGNRYVRHLTYELSRFLFILGMLVCRRQVDLWMARHSLFGLPLLLAGKVAKTVVLEVNGPVREEIETNFGSRRLAKVVDFFFRLQIRSADLVVTVSPGLEDYVRERVSSAHVTTIPNGAEAPPPGTARPESEDEVDLVFSGALTPWYDMDTVFQAMRILADSGVRPTLKIVGDGAEMAEWRSTVSSLGLSDQVKFVGWVAADEAQQHVLAGRVGVLPLVVKSTRTAAIGSPLKLYEYAACGLGIVATRLDGIANSPLSEFVFLFEPGDPQACADAMAAALEGGRQAYDRATWSWESRARNIVREVEVKRPAVS